MSTIIETQSCFFTTLTQLDNIKKRYICGNQTGYHDGDKNFYAFLGLYIL